MSGPGNIHYCSFLMLSLLHHWLQSEVPNAKIGFSKAMSAGWIRLDKSGDKPRVFRKVSFEKSCLTMLK